jgi:hypothetical protein
MGGGASLHLANSNGAIEAAIAECVDAAAEAEAQRRRSAKDKGQSGSGRRVGSVKTLKSLKSMAMKSYSRQENVYIPHENILSASATHLNKFQNSGKGAALAPLGGSTGSLSSGNASKPGSTMGSFRKTPPGSGNNLVVNGAGENSGAAAPSSSTAPAAPTPKKGIKPVLRINIQDDAVDKRKVDKAHAYEISVVSTIYSWFDWLIYIHMLLAQVDMVIIEMSADVVASTAITYWYMEKSPGLSRSTDDASVHGPGEYAFIALTDTQTPTVRA